jgi:signal transduction histidine kinase
MSAITEFPSAEYTSSTELSVFFQNAPVGFAECEQFGHVTAVNPALERILDRTSKLQSLALADIIHPQDPTTGEQLLGELFKGDRECVQIDSTPVSPSGSPVRWTIWRASGIAEERDPYFLALAEPAPASAELEQRVRQSQRLETVGRLAGGIAHDFNNLLTGVLLYCDLLMASLEPGNRIRKYAEEIRNAGLQATGLVRQLLNVARPAHPEPRLLSLNEVIQGMRNLLVRLIGENIQIELNLDPDLGLIRIDPTHAQQILLNLVLNARDAMPTGGMIQVGTSNGKIQVITGADREMGAGALPCAVFVVTDNGTGMDASTRDHLFEAFFTTKGRKGTGLGLATVHDIVTGNGGLIHVDSAPGKGTRITVLLPLAIEAEQCGERISKTEFLEGAHSATTKE